MKKQLVAMVAIFLLVASTSASVARGEPQLKEWYEDLFSPLSEDLGAKTVEGLLLTFRTSKVIGNQTQAAFSLAMLEFSDRETKGVVLGIEEYRKRMQGELRATSIELEKQNFESYKAQLSIEQTVAEDMDAVLAGVLSEK